MTQRIIKACGNCNYELVEQANNDESRCVVGDCTCPQCGGKAKHFMFIDKRNLPCVEEIVASNVRHAEVVNGQVNKV